MSPSVVPVRQNWRFFVRITHYSRFGSACSGEICGSAGDHNFVNDFLTRGSLSNVSNPFYNAAAERGLQFKSVSTALRFVPRYGSGNTSELVAFFQVSNSRRHHNATAFESSRVLVASRLILNGGQP